MWKCESKQCFSCFSSSLEFNLCYSSTFFLSWSFLNMHRFKILFLSGMLSRIKQSVEQISHTKIFVNIIDVPHAIAVFLLSKKVKKGIGLHRIKVEISLKTEMENMSERQQPDQRADNSRIPPMTLNCSEKIPHRCGSQLVSSVSLSFSFQIIMYSSQFLSDQERVFSILGIPLVIK